MRKMIVTLILLALIGAFVAHPAMAKEPDKSGGEDTDPAGGVKSIEERVRELEEAAGRTVTGDRWYDRIKISGLIEVEAGYGETDVKDPTAEDEETSDVDLAAVELGVDAKIADHVDGHALIKFEDDDVFIDEGFIALTGSESIPVYLTAGRQYIPFGNFDSFFVTDPNTLVLGETNEGAVIVGYRFLSDTIDVSAGAFNGEAQKAGDDDAVDSFVAAVTVQPFEGLNLGVSYTSNLAGSDSFNDEVVDPDNLDALVGAWSAFVTFEFLERFKLIGEYVGAMDNFKAGEIYDPSDPIERQPSAWNVELGVGLTEALEVALRYGGSDDGGNTFLPETQYGAVVNWGFFDNTNLALEYLHGEFEDDYQETDSVTAQLAVEF